MSKQMILALLALILTLALLLLRCSGDPVSPGEGEPTPVAQMVSHSDCKTFGTRWTTYYATANQTCLSYQYDGASILQITRTDAAFNCCVDSLIVSVDVSGTVITVTEVEWLTAPCRCLCLYDLEYQISDIPPGVVTLRFVEPYTEAGDDDLELSLNLASSPSGSVCVPRDHYPWADE